MPLILCSVSPRYLDLAVLLQKGCACCSSTRRLAAVVVKVVWRAQCEQKRDRDCLAVNVITLINQIISDQIFHFHVRIVELSANQMVRWMSLLVPLAGRQSLGFLSAGSDKLIWSST